MISKNLVLTNGQISNEVAADALASGAKSTLPPMHPSMGGGPEDAPAANQTDASDDWDSDEDQTNG
jgi:hypothetical protein